MSKQEMRNEDGELLSVTQSLRVCLKHFINLLDDQWAEATGNLLPDMAAKYDTMRIEARAVLKMSEEPLDWSQCPCCGADAENISYDGAEIEEGDALQKANCIKCEATWGEWYRADERVIYDEGNTKK